MSAACCPPSPCIRRPRTWAAREPPRAAPRAPARVAPPATDHAVTPADADVIAALDALREEVECCSRCVLHDSRTRAVFGEGDPGADLMFVGEAPGYHEDQQGRPFVGQAGKLLEQLLASIGLTREQVYIANVLKSRPPNNRDPRPEEIDACRPYLWRQIEIIEPRVICTLGNFATKLLPRQSRGHHAGARPSAVDADRRPPAVPVSDLPSRRGALHAVDLTTLEEDFQRLPELLSHAAPQTGKRRQRRRPRSGRPGCRPSACGAGGGDRRPARRRPRWWTRRVGADAGRMFPPSPPSRRRHARGRAGGTRAPAHPVRRRAPGATAARLRAPPRRPPPRAARARRGPGPTADAAPAPASRRPLPRPRPPAEPEQLGLF